MGSRPAGRRVCVWKSLAESRADLSAVLSQPWPRDRDRNLVIQCQDQCRVLPPPRGGRGEGQEARAEAVGRGRLARCCGHTACLGSGQGGRPFIEYADPWSVASGRV